MLRQRCHHCRAKLKFARERIGLTIPCPRCGTEILLTDPDSPAGEADDDVVFRTWPGKKATGQPGAAGNPAAGQPDVDEPDAPSSADSPAPTTAAGAKTGARANATAATVPAVAAPSAAAADQVTAAAASAKSAAGIVAWFQSLSPVAQIASAAVGGAVCATAVFAVALRSGSETVPNAGADPSGGPVSVAGLDDLPNGSAQNGGGPNGSGPAASGGAGDRGSRDTIDKNTAAARDAAGADADRSREPFPASEFHGVARLASQLYYVDQKPAPFPSRGYVERARGVRDPKLKQAAETAWQAALAYEAAVELRGEAAEAQDSALGNLAMSAIAGTESFAVDPYDEREQQRAAENRRYARRMAGESLEAFLKTAGAGATSDALFRQAAQQQLAAWQQLKPFAEKALTEKPAADRLPISLSIDYARQQDENISQAVLRGLYGDAMRRSGVRQAVFAENSSGRELTSVTLMITFKSPWETVSSDAAMLGGAKVAGRERFNFYFIPRWPAGQRIELDPGFEWGAAAIRRTFDADWSLSSDQLAVRPTAHRFEANFRRYVIEELDLAEDRVSRRGLWEPALETATQIASVLPAGSEFAERTERLRVEAVRVRDNLQALRRLLVKDSRFSGRWVFGKFVSPAAVRCVEAPAAEAINGDFELHVFAPDQPSLFRPLRGQLIFSPHVGVWTVGATSSVLDRRGQQQRPNLGEPHEPQFADLLNSNDEQGLSFYFNDASGTLAADGPEGDSLTLLSETAPDFAARRDELLNSPPQQPERLTMRPIEPIPAEILQAVAAGRGPSPDAEPAADDEPATDDVRTGNGGPLAANRDALTALAERTRVFAREKAGLGATGYRVDVVTFDTTGQRAASLVAGSEFRTWNLRTGRPMSNVKVNSNGSSAITSDLKIIANAQRTRLGLFDVASAKQVARLDADSTVVTIGGPKDDLLATGGRRGVVMVWNRKGDVLLTAPHAAEVLAISIADDGRSLWAATRDGRLTFWDLSTQQSGPVLEGYPHHVRQILASPDGQFVLTASEVLIDRNFARHQHRYELQIRRVSGAGNGGSGEPLWTLEFPFLGEAVAITSDWTRVALGSLNGPVLIWDLRTGEPLKRLVGHRGKVTAVTWSPDEQSLLSGAGDLWMIHWSIP